ncbi:MAG TPA: hypothetical protein VME47_09250 [Acetobacteraceae bacterium]|nr:hypothetical protein [Acetobacteraceae bacterium]
MISNALTSPAYAYAPDADRAGPDASARLLHRLHMLDLLPLLHGLVRFLVLVAFLVREYWLAIRQYRAGTRPMSGCCRSDLPPGPAQQPAALVRGAFGNAIAWMIRRCGIAPAHSDWLDPSRAIVAFSSAPKGFRHHAQEATVAGRVATCSTLNGSRPGLPTCGLQSWENPNIPPGTIGGIVETSAAPAIALLLSRHKFAAAPSPTQGIAGCAPAWSVACVPAIRALAEIFPIWDQY